MAIFELRTYTLYVGKMSEAVKHYSESGWPALKKGGFDSKLVGYFTTDVGTINQLVHLWRFEDDADRRDPDPARLPPVDRSPGHATVRPIPGSPLF